MQKDEIGAHIPQEQATAVILSENQPSLPIQYPAQSL